MSFELAGNPKKMLAGYLNKADLGEVTGEGIRQGAISETKDYLRKLGMLDAEEALEVKEFMADERRDLRSEIAGMEMDVDRFGTILGAGTTMAAGAMKGSDFSLFGDKGVDKSPLNSGITGTVGGDGGSAADYYQLNNDSYYGDSSLVDWMN